MPTYRRYSDVAIGDLFPPSPSAFAVTDAVVDAFCAATGEPSRRHGPLGSGGRRPAPPTLAAAYIMDVMRARGGPPGGVHAKQKFTFFRAPEVGDVLFSQGRVVEKFEKKGRNYVVASTETRDAVGALVCTGVITSIWGFET